MCANVSKSDGLDLSSLQPPTVVSNCLSHWKEAYESCVQTNQPSLDELMMNLKSHHPTCFSLIRSVRSFQKQQFSKNNESFLREIQLQIRLRLTLWHHQGETFIQKYQRRMMKKQRKTKKIKTPLSSTMTMLSWDVVRLLELAVFQLEPVESAFDTFLKATITTDLKSLPLNFIWEAFEKVNPFVAPQAPVLSPLRLKSKKRKQQASSQQARKTKQVQVPQDQEVILSSDKENMDSFTIPVSVPFIAPRKKTKASNSLLGAPKSYFVGSHFNTNLANAQTLFRQVPVYKHRTTNISQSNCTKFKHPKQQRPVLASNIVPLTPGLQQRIPVVPETPQPVVKRSSMMVVNNPMPPPPPRTASQVVAEALSSLERREKRRHRGH